MNLSKVLVKTLKERGLSLTRLGKLSGVPVATLHGWTTGRSNLNLDHLKRVANVLQISIHELVYGEPDPYGVNSNLMLQEIFSGDVRVTLHRIHRVNPKSNL